VKKTETSSVDVFAGARLFSIDFSTSWQLTAAITTPVGQELLSAQGSVGSDTDLWDAIVGVRGHFGIGDGNWSVPYYFDVGAGSSDLTWNAVAGVSRSFGWGDLLFAYRHLEYDEDSDGLMQNSASVDRHSARHFAFDSTFTECQGVIMLNQNSKLSNNDIISSSEPAFPSTAITPFSIRVAGGLPSKARATSPCRLSDIVASASGLCVADL
jgi:hypothetical protein